MKGQSMEFIGKGKIKKALIWSVALSFFLLLLEVRYLIGDRETDQGLGYLFMVQVLFLLLTFLAVPLSAKNFKEVRCRKLLLNSTEIVGMSLLIGLFFLALLIAVFPPLMQLVLPGGYLLAGIGLYLHLKKPSAVAVSFMLWGMFVVVLVHLMVFGVYGSF